MKQKSIVYQRLIAVGLILIGIFLFCEEKSKGYVENTVYAESGEKSEKYEKVKALEFKHSYMSIRAGEKVALEFFMKPEKNIKYAFESTKPNLLSVTSKGIVKADKDAAGRKIKVILKAKDGSGIRDRIWLYVLPPINPNKKMVALTFDDGPKASITGRICKVLKESEGVATFFVVGEALTNKVNKNVMKQAFRQGNEIASHTLNHKQLTKLSAIEIQRQIQKNDVLIQKITGTQVQLLRPPYGSISPFVAKQVEKPMILWSIDTRDWSHLNASKTYTEVMSKVHDGSIILMHDYYTQTADAVEKIVPVLKKNGYQFVTVSELYHYKGKKIKKGSTYRGF